MNDTKQFAVVTRGSSRICLQLLKVAENDFDVLIAANDDGIGAATVV